MAKVLRPCDIELREGGRKLMRGEYHRATAVSIRLRSSKSDQYNEGCVLTHHLAGESDLDLCVVRALRDLAITCPTRWEEEAHLPLSRWIDGKPVTREEIRRLLAAAAVEEGLPPEAVGVHSLRSGGASALFQASGGNKPLVQRMGRWASDAFSGYVWEDHTLTRGMAAAMLAAPWAAHSGAF